MRVYIRLSSGGRTAQTVLTVFGPSRLLTLLVAACFFGAAPVGFAQRSPEIFREIQVEALQANDGSGQQGPSVVRNRYVEVDLESILPQDAPPDPSPLRARGESRRRLVFNLFADAAYEFEEERGEYSADGQTYSWFGRPTADGGDQAVVVVHDGNVAGSVRTRSGEFYRIRSVSAGVHVIRQVTYQGTPAVNDAVPVPESEVPQAAKLQQQIPVAQQSGLPMLDVMIVYTAAARQAAGGASGIQNEIQLAIAELNQSFSNSGVQMQAQLVHSVEMSYNDQVSLSTTLSRLRSPGDGYLDQVHALRDQYGADVVAMLVNGPGANGGTVGTGYVMQTVGSYFEAYAFSVTEVNFATGPSYALLHEIGHNLGCAHDRDHAGSPGAYSYSYGFQRSQTPRFRTIMSYNCSGVNCPTVNHWSDPNVTYQGNPTGVASSQSNSANNRETLNRTRVTATVWRQGTQSVQQAPAAVSVSPASGSGSSQMFTYTFTDANGYQDIPAVQMVINNAVETQNSCYFYFSRRRNYLYLFNDAGNAWLGPIGIGSSKSLQNAQCQVSGSQSSFSDSGNTVTVKLAVTFNAAFAGAKNSYMHVHDLGGLNSGWQQRGTWTVPGGSVSSAPQAVSVSPSSGTGSTQMFTYSLSDANGYDDVPVIQFLINSSLSTQNACYVYFSRRRGLLLLLNDAGSAWVGNVGIGSSNTLQNSQCRVNAAQSSYTNSGNQVTVKLALTFLPSFAGNKSNYMHATDLGGLNSGWQARGTWTVPGAVATTTPQAIAVSPSSGTGVAQTFTYMFSDSNGYADIPAVEMLINDTLSQQNACRLYFSRRRGTLFLLNDAGTAWEGHIGIDYSNSIENSQCSVSAAQSSFSNSGNNVTVRLAITFKPGFAGLKTNYMYVRDLGGLNSGWQARGTWTVPASNVGALSMRTR